MTACLVIDSVPLEPAFHGLSHYTLTHQLDPLQKLPAGHYPKSVSISPDGQRAYVCNLEAGTVDVYDAKTQTPLQKIVFERTPVEVTIQKKKVMSFEEKPVEIGFTGKGGSSGSPCSIPAEWWFMILWER